MEHKRIRARDFRAHTRRWDTARTGERNSSLVGRATKSAMMPHTAYAMLDLLMKIASGLGEENRRKLADQMHGAADYLESSTRSVGDDRHAIH